MDQLLVAFITEARDNLEAASRCFLELEKDPDDTEIMDDLFRSMHTIKGSSGLFDIPAFTHTVHAAEDVLDTVRNGDLKLESDSIDLLLDSMDRVSEWIDQLEESGNLDQSAGDISREYTQKLRLLITEDSEEADATQAGVDCEAEKKSGGDTEDSQAIPIEKPSWFQHIPEAIQQEFSGLDASTRLLGLLYQPDTNCFFSGDDPLHTVRNLPGMRWSYVKEREPWAEPVAMDPFHANITFFAVCEISRDELNQYLRYIYDQVQLSELTPAHFTQTGDVSADTDVATLEPSENVSNPGIDIPEEEQAVIRDIIATQMEIIDLPFSEAQLTGRVGSLSQVAVRLADRLGGPEVNLESIAQACEQAHSLKPLATVFGSLLDNLNGNLNAVSASAQSIESSAQFDLESPARCNLAEAEKESLRNIIVTQIEILSLPFSETQLSGRVASLSQVAARILGQLEGLKIDIENAVQSCQQENTLGPLQLVFEVFLAVLDGGANKTQAPVASSALAVGVESGVEAEEKTQENNDQYAGSSAEKKAENQSKIKEEEPTNSRKNVPISKTIKVDQSRIDAVMDLVGELVVAKNSLPFLAAQAEEEFGVKLLAKEIKAQYAVIDRLAESLQSTMMQVRMVPVSHIFQRFPRLVRDLSRKLDKKINLILEGEETEADKNVVENMADPLIHLVRNSLDHGLETAEERKSLGKRETGTITLKAIPHEDQVVIEVSDDGRGIDPANIKQKAYEKGVIDEERLDSITDQEALQLIFAPGFSTAEQVSDLSGRGVGMDVVRTVVTNSGGQVSVHSKLGQGSTTRLSLPLSMAVTRVMMVEVAGQIYGVSMEHVVETVRVSASAIEPIKQREVVVLRDRLIPVFHLRKLMNIDALTYQKDDEVAILVMKIQGEEIGLVIDEFHEGIDILLKPLEGVMSDFPIYAGSALLGNGRVLLVLNIQEFIECQ